MILEPCRLFNTQTCPEQSGSCLYSHQPDDNSIQFSPGLQNNCKKHLLGGLGFTEGCKVEAGECPYRHGSPDEVESSTLEMDPVIKLVQQERTNRLLTGAACEDIDTFIKRKWVERANRIATDKFVDICLEDLSVDIEEGTAVMSEPFKKCMEDFERNREAHMEAMKAMLIEECEEYDEGYYFQFFLRPKLIKFLPLFVPTEDKGQEAMYRDEVKKMRQAALKLNDEQAALLESRLEDEDEEGMYGFESDDEFDYEAMFGSDDDDMEDDEEGMLGFSASDVMELAAQGVHPWDDDAGAVLDALNGC